jgi:hypothetical protein
MGLFGHDHLIDDVDVESCLENLHRLDGIGPMHVIDLISRPRADLTVPERRAPTPA